MRTLNKKVPSLINIFAGDLNAGGQYVKISDLEKSRLRNVMNEEKQVYSWLIQDHVDTTATNTLAAYDRQLILNFFMNQNYETKI